MCKFKVVRQLMDAEEKGNIVRLLHKSSYSRLNMMSNRVKNWARRKNNWNTAVIKLVTEAPCFANKMLQLMVEMGADIRSRDFNTGWMVNHFAANDGNAKFLRFLFKTFKNSISLYETTNDGSNVLHIASKNGNYKVIKLLVHSFKMNTQTCNHQGQSAIDLVIEKGENDNRIFHLLS